MARHFTQTNIILDGFVSPYDTICLDRKHVPAESSLGILLKRAERRAYESVDRILFDTRTHADYIVREFSLPSDKVDYLYVNADESVFYPIPKTPSEDKCNVLWYGSFLPLQGVGVIMEAMELLSEESGLSFTIVGRGIESPGFLRWLANASHPPVTYVPWLPLSELGDLTRAADVFLGGHFSNIPKARRVIPTKAIEGAAAGRAMILGDNPANREIFRPNIDAAFVEMWNSVELAEAISDLAVDPSLRRKYGERSREAYLKSASSEVIASNLETIISDVMSN